MRFAEVYMSSELLHIEWVVRVQGKHRGKIKIKEEINQCSNVLTKLINEIKNSELPQQEIDDLLDTLEGKGNKSLFYPDYILKFKEGSIGIYEIKHVNDQGEKKTDKKILSLISESSKNGVRN